MAKPTHSDVAAELLERHGQTYAEEAGIDLRRGTPAPLFQLLVLSLLLSARIRANAAVSAARALFGNGWTTAPKMAGSTWEQRTKTLNESGYARYDESTSRMLGHNADLLVDDYRCDLRRLREAANREPDQERALLMRCKGMGDVGVDIFFREVQIAWDELEPFADDRTLKNAKELGLPANGAKLRGLVDDTPTYARLVSAIIRSTLARDGDEILDAVRRRGRRS